MGDENIATKLTPTGMRKLCESDSQELRKTSAGIFDAAAGAWGKGIALAEHLDMSMSTVSEMRNGKRPVPFHVQLAVMADREAARVGVGIQAELTGLVVVTLRTEVQLSPGERKLLGFLRRSGMWKFIARFIAREFYGIEQDTLEEAIDFWEAR